MRPTELVRKAGIKKGYLSALEHLPRRVYWGELKIDAQRWPASTMTVTVYTISLEKTWWRV